MNTPRILCAISLATTLLLGLTGCSGAEEPVVVQPTTTATESTTTAVEVITPQPVPLDQLVITLEPVIDGFTQPLFVTGAGDGSGRLFVLEKTGRAWIVRDGVRSAKPFLDLSNAVSTDSERGLLGMAFPPTFPTDGLFYVDYTDRDGTTTISRFTASGDTVDRASEQKLLTVVQPFANHNGGMIAFGPEGYLYIGMGDGGSSGDPKGNGQNFGTLLGAILRIDVSGTDGYAVPPDNTFASHKGARPEVWAYGLRNPWRFSFDREIGDLWIGDVGQSTWEEIDFQPASSIGGENYGWNLYEATHSYPPGTAAASGEFTPPVIEYGRAAGQSVTGGYVYRGSAYEAMWNTYLYGDFGSGALWGLRRADDGTIENRLLLETGFSLVSFGEDDSGELYVVDFGGGAIYRVVAE
ncbi:MAG: PQQ-dependent sugar dehydrogenase [Coriobacteriia bacterium]|nr:PQQ-dependent sugar dehydrogenase [Coriobacteriia bacterium]